MASYPAPSENLSVFTPSTFNTLTEVGPGIQFENGTIQTTAYTGGGGGSQTLAQTLVLGNSAGTTSINMNNQNITNLPQITSSGDLTLNPTGTTIHCSGKILDISGGEIHKCPLIHSPNNSNITIEGRGTGVVILKGNNANTQIQSTGLTTVPTLEVQDMTTTREVEIYTNATALTGNPIVQANDTTIIGKGTTLTDGVIDIATNSATTCGIRLTNNTALIGAGGTSATPTHYVKCDPSNSLIDISGNTKITGNLEVTGTLTNNMLNQSYISGQLYSITGTKGPITASNLAAGNIYYIPIFITKTQSFNAFCILKTTTNTPTAYTLYGGIYTNVNGQPNTLIGGTQTFSIPTGTAQTMINTATFTTPITLNRGFYWLGTGLSTASLVSYSTNTLYGINVSPLLYYQDLLGTYNEFAYTGCQIYSQTSFSTTTLPATASPTLNTPSGVIPAFGIRAV
jgi:hypothetical protein